MKFCMQMYLVNLDLEHYYISRSSFKGQGHMFFLCFSVCDTVATTQSLEKGLAILSLFYFLNLFYYFNGRQLAQGAT